MTNHVAVLKVLRGRIGGMEDSKANAALDHAIAAVAERDALVARLGELEAREAAWYDLVQRAWQVLDIECPNEEITDELLAALTNADDLARVVKEGGG